MSQPIQLQLFNNAEGFEDFVCVILQKNLLPALTDSFMAWQLIRNLGAGETYLFEFSEDLTVEVGDVNGNVSDQLDAQYGLMYKAVKDPSERFIQEGYAQHSDEIDVFNAFPQSSIFDHDINAFCRRSGIKLAAVMSVPPGQRASFKFDSTIFLGVVSPDEMEDPEGLNRVSPDLLPLINTEISLQGISSADIVMTGVPGLFEFTLQNVVYA